MSDIFVLSQCVSLTNWQAAPPLRKTSKSNTQEVNNPSMNNGYFVQSQNKINLCVNMKNTDKSF